MNLWARLKAIWHGPETAAQMALGMAQLARNDAIIGQAIGDQANAIQIMGTMLGDDALPGERGRLYERRTH